MLVKKLLCMAVLLLASSGFAQEVPAVTVEEAAKVIDLRKLTLPTESVQPVNKGVACINFKSTGDVKATLEFFQKQLHDLGWKETVQPFVNATSSSATFGKEGYHLSFFAMKDLDKKAGERISVNLINMGNVDTRKLPVPENAKALISQAMSTHYICETMSQEDGKKIMREKLIALGWEPYGKAADAQYFKKNAIKLEMYVTKSPSQNNKTAVRYASRLMSVDVPAPVEASLVQYHDMPTQVMVVTKGTLDEVARWYTQNMPKRGWKPMSEKPIKDQLNSYQIFQNDGKETLKVTYQQVRTDVHVKATVQEK